jgi:RNA-splicing ligase RtcB
MVIIKRWMLRLIVKVDGTIGVIVLKPVVVEREQELGTQLLNRDMVVRRVQRHNRKIVIHRVVERVRPPAPNVTNLLVVKYITKQDVKHKRVQKEQKYVNGNNLKNI